MSAIHAWNGTDYSSVASLKGMTNSNSFNRLGVHQGLPPYVSLNAVGGTITGSTLDCVTCHSIVTMAVTLSFGVAPTSISTQLQGSLDGNNWFNVGAAVTSTVAGVTIISANVSARYFRAATTVTGGTTISVTALIGVAG